jgi:hypothetical protein
MIQKRNLAGKAEEGATSKDWINAQLFG